MNLKASHVHAIGKQRMYISPKLFIDLSECFIDKV